MSQGVNALATNCPNNIPPPLDVTPFLVEPTQGVFGDRFGFFITLADRERGREREGRGREREALSIDFAHAKYISTASRIVLAGGEAPKRV